MHNNYITTNSIENKVNHIWFLPQSCKE